MGRSACFVKKKGETKLQWFSLFLFLEETKIKSKKAMIINNNKKGVVR
jgi:hypothetical protein